MVESETEYTQGDAANGSTNFWGKDNDGTLSIPGQPRGSEQQPWSTVPMPSIEPDWPRGFRQRDDRRSSSTAPVPGTSSGFGGIMDAIEDVVRETEDMAHSFLHVRKSISWFHMIFSISAKLTLVCFFFFFLCFHLCGTCRCLGWMEMRRINQVTHLIVGLEVTYSVALKGEPHGDQRLIHPTAQRSRHQRSRISLTRKIFERFDTLAEFLQGFQSDRHRKRDKEPYCSVVQLCFRRF